MWQEIIEEELLKEVTMPNESSTGFSLRQFTKILAGGFVLVAAASAAADDFELLAKRCVLQRWQSTHCVHWSKQNRTLIHTL